MNEQSCCDPQLILAGKMVHKVPRDSRKWQHSRTPWHVNTEYQVWASGQDSAEQQFSLTKGMFALQVFMSEVRGSHKRT